MNALATKSTADGEATRKKHPASSPVRPPPGVQTKPIYRPPIQLKSNCACGGGCPRCSEDDLDIQTKLAIGEPGDTYEQEADQVADLVMRTPDPSQQTDLPSTYTEHDFTVQTFLHPTVSQLQRSSIEGHTTEGHGFEFGRAMSESLVRNSSPSSSPGTVISDSPRQAHSVLQKQSDEQPEEEPGMDETPLQMSGVAAAGLVEPPDEDDEDKTTGTISPKSTFANSRTGTTRSTAHGIEDGLQRSRGSGVALPTATREFMEQRFRVDLSGVRVHANSESHRLNQGLHAYAFTTGHDIFFAEGMYRPGTSAGDHLLAHELTHVLQQTGGVALKRAPQTDGKLIQRAGDDEYKSYTIPGNEVHRQVEKVLEEVNTTLMTEVPIPGGTSDDRRLNLRGFADLYESEGNIVTGIRGKYPGSDPKNPLYYENIHHLGRLSPAKRAKQGPRILARDGKKVTSWDTNPDFPSSFKVADIKPLHIYRIESGKFQLENYIKGFQEFVAKVHSDSGATRASTKGETLSITLPPALDYKQFGTEYAALGKHAVVIPKIAPKADAKKGSKQKRIWIYELPKAGIYVYFELPHPYLSTTYPKELDEILKKLDPLLGELRDKHPTLGQTKRKPGTPPKHPGSPTRPMPAASRSTLQLQRDPEYWRKRSVTWEEKRLAWESGEKGAKAFLKGAAKGAVERLKVDEALNIPASGAQVQQNKALKQVQLWSGPSGKLLGMLRFRFGGMFDKLGGLYDKVKKWFEKRPQSEGKDLDFGSGPIATAAEVAFKLMKQFLIITARRVGDHLTTALQSGATAMLNHFFTGPLMERFSEETDALKKKIEEVQSISDGLHEKFDTKITEVLSVFEDAKKFLDQVRSGLKTVGDIVSLVKWGIRLFHCATPPIVGCLKLVLEKLSEALIKVVIKSCWFQGKAIRPLFNTVSFFKELPRDIAYRILDLVREILPLPEPELSLLLPPKPDIPDTNIKEGELKCDPDKPTAEQKALAEMFDKYGEKRVEQMFKLLEKKDVEDGMKLNVYEIKRIDNVMEKMSNDDFEKAINNPEAFKGSPAGIGLEEMVSKLKLNQLDKKFSEFTGQLVDTAEVTGKLAGRVTSARERGIYNDFEWYISFDLDQLKNNKVGAMYYEFHNGQGTAAFVELEIISLDRNAKWISARIAPKTLLVNEAAELGDSVTRATIEGTYTGGDDEQSQGGKK